jgi:hypothetical protein
VEFEFDLATPEDDPALRALMAATPMPGRVTVAFERKPGFYQGCRTMGPFYQVLVARRKAGQEIAVVICRAVRQHYINGKAHNLGYIGGIRVAEDQRGRWLLQRGLPFLRLLHADERTQIYWGAISDENHVSRGVLIERARRNFPQAREVACIYTLAIILRNAKPVLPFPGQIERGSSETLDEIVAFLQTQGAQRQFFPRYTAADFGPGGTTPGFDLADFFVARRDGRIVGVIGLWDQGSFKQSIVRGYDRSLRLLKPVYNLAARLVGMPPLSEIGGQIHSAYASFICIANGDPVTFAALLRSMYNLAAQRGYAYLMLGLTKDDPLLPLAQKYAHIAYHSRVYLGAWEEDIEIGKFCRALDERIPYFEIANL